MSQNGQYLPGWTGSLQIVLELILAPDVRVCFVWPRRKVFVCLALYSHRAQREHCVYIRGCLSHFTSDMGESSYHYISMDTSQSNKCVLKS